MVNCASCGGELRPDRDTYITTEKGKYWHWDCWQKEAAR